MIILIAALLALLVLHWPWNLAVFLAAAFLEPAGVMIAIRWTRRRRSQVGAQVLIGARGEVITILAPRGQVKLGGEIWQAHCEEQAWPGETVRVRRVDGLTLEVERVP
jgi:membrane protein implicated in regulation of membrane protease activity